MSEFDPTEHETRVDEMIAHLTYIRSFILVGASLVEKYPTDKEWEDATNDPVILEGLQQLSMVLSDIENTANSDEFLDIDDVLEMSEAHHDRALEALTTVSDLIDVPAEDLVVILTDS